VSEFTALYWGQQASTAGTLVLLTTAGALIGGLGYGFTRPKPKRRQAGTYAQETPGA
jgi:hypothetical protein